MAPGVVRRGAFDILIYAGLEFSDKMKFRIKKLPTVGYFAQVRIFILWRTIGRHPVGFGLYPNNHIDYPLDTREEALNLCTEYYRWRKMFGNIKPIYEVVLN